MVDLLWKCPSNRPLLCNSGQYFPLRAEPRRFLWLVLSDGVGAKTLNSPVRVKLSDKCDYNCISSLPCLHRKVKSQCKILCYLQSNCPNEIYYQICVLLMHRQLNIKIFLCSLYLLKDNIRWAIITGLSTIEGGISPIKILSPPINGCYPLPPLLPT